MGYLVAQATICSMAVGAKDRIYGGLDNDGITGGRKGDKILVVMVMIGSTDSGAETASMVALTRILY